MACECPVCGRQIASVSALFSHLERTHDLQYGQWLVSYCQSNNIDSGKLLLDCEKRMEDASKPLTDALKRDFCKG